jgi:tungstate transport system ATP-binding protein
MRDAMFDQPAPPAHHPTAPERDPRRLEVRGLSLVLEGHARIRDVSLALAPTGITVLMGPNGAGKSLFLRMLHGLVPPSAGTITWGSEPISDRVRKRQALVFQKPVLMRRTVAANIDFVLAARGRRDRARRDELLRHVGLAGHATQPARLLSGGEQQRLAIARALATEPEVLFLDEATASLDPASVLMIEEIVRAARDAGTRILFVSHDAAQARRLADDVVFLHEGTLVEQGPAEAFFAGPSSAVARDYLAGRILI